MRKIFLILFTVLSFASEAQVYTPMTAPGYQYKRLAPDSTLHIPTFCGLPNLRSINPRKQGAIAFDSCNHRFYFYDPKRLAWDTTAGGGLSQSALNDSAAAIRADFPIGSQNLQQVTTFGNVTTNPVIIDSGSFTAASLFPSENSGGLLLGNSSDYTGIVKATNLSEHRLYELPNAPGTIPISVNGYFADASGNIGIPATNNADTSYFIDDSTWHFVSGDGREWDMRLIDPEIPSGTDTVSLSDRINLKADQSALEDTAAAIRGDFPAGSDTTSLSDRINLKLNISDTAAMLEPYGHYSARFATGLPLYQLALGNNVEAVAATTASQNNLLIADTVPLINNDIKVGYLAVKTGYGTGAANTGSFWSGYFETRVGATNTANLTNTQYGVIGATSSTNTQPGSTGNLTRAVSFDGVCDYSGMNILNSYRFFARDAYVHGTAVVTNNYGVYIDPQLSGTNNFGLFSASQNNVIAPTASLTNGFSALRITATQPAAPIAPQYGVNYQITSAGSANLFNGGLNVSYLPGYTGPNVASAIVVSNTAAGTGAGILAGNNRGVSATVTGTTNGTNLGMLALASNGNINVGLFGTATTTKNNAKNIGVVGYGLNAGTTSVQIGGYFGLHSADPTLTTSAGLMADNGATTSPIFVARDNGTIVYEIQDGGKIAIAATNTPAGTTGAQTINKAAGSVNLAAGATTLTVTNSFVTASSLVFLQVNGTDATATSARVTAGAGSFTITLNAAATSETKVSFHVFN